MTVEPRRKLAIIGCGSSGLITLKNAIDRLPDWETICFERTDNVRGCWGSPPKGFVSTSTKYTTQFACYAPFTATVRSNEHGRREEFFRDNEYGDYLESFADHFGLRRHIRLKTIVESVARNDGDHGWIVNTQSNTGQASSEAFDALVICTGLASVPKTLTPKTLGTDNDVGPQVISSMADLESKVRNSRVVVFGGGESAVDFADRLSRPELGNETYLSLRGGVRVSPRYHPIRGVPSDFLRNRLMLSIHPGLRNRLGEFFVRSRIRYERAFQRVFKSTTSVDMQTDATSDQSFAIKRRWAMRLTVAAKDQLFNMFHNKSDDFLDAVADGRLKIIGPPMNETHCKYFGFDRDETLDIDPQWIVPAIGFRSTIAAFSDGQAKLADFYLGCIHSRYRDLFAVGYARPIIGNIPTISEMQARLICEITAGRIKRPDDLESRHQVERERRKRRYGEIDNETVFPVEMFPYCDELARQLGCYPSVGRVGGWRRWWRLQRIPASTLHYDWTKDSAELEGRNTRVYLPPTLIGLLMLIKPMDWIYRLFGRG